MIKTIGLLVISNLFMTFAWYGHLKTLKDRPLYIAILVSWLIALAEYIFQVPANRIGIGHFTLPQLKIIQEIITMIVFAGFAILYMKSPVTKNFFYASICMVGAAYFMFKKA
jgi:uncharacterized protein (DUF486 family)